MILYNSTQVRVFNGNGFAKEKVLLLKLFNNFNIKQFIKIIKIVEIQFKVLFNLKLYLKKIVKFFLSDCLLFINFKKNKKLKIFLIKKFLIFYFFKVYKQHNVLAKLYNLDNVKRAEDFYLSYKLKKNKLDLVKKTNFLRNYTVQLSKLKNINNNNIFIVGEVYNYYRGSITPFYNSKLSWFISTGLKSDIECGDPHLVMDYNQSIHLETKFRSIFVKLDNFKKPILSNIKKKARHLFHYNFSNFFGFQRFISESSTSFNYKNNFTLLNQFFFLQSVKINRILNFSFNFNDYNFFNFNTNYGFFFISKKKTMVLNKQINLFFSILFYLSKSISSYYLLLNAEVLNIINSSITIYRSLFSFINLRKNYYKIYKRLFKLIYSNFLYDKYKLVKRTSVLINLYFNKILLLILFVFKLNLLFFNKVFLYISKNSFFDIFFSIFLLCKKRVLLIKSLNNIDLSISEKTQIYIKLLEKPYWIGMYKKFFYYLYFLIDWKINFDLLISKFNNYTSFSYLDLVDKIKKPFRELRLKWHITFFINIKELYVFFFFFLEEIIIKIQKLFYFYVLTKLNIKQLFKFLNLYIYLNKLSNKDFKSKSFFLNNIIELSSFFLGKWFYYRHLQKFLDTTINYNYSFYKPVQGFFLLKNHNFVNFNLELYLKDSSKYLDESFKYNSKLKLTKLWFFNKKKPWTGYNEHKYLYFNRLKLLTLLKKKVYDYRKSVSANKQQFYLNNFLKKGTFFKLPKLTNSNKLWNLKGLDFFLINLPKKRELLLKYNKHYLSKFYKLNNSLVLSNTFLILYKNLMSLKVKKSLYYNFWFSN